MMKTIIALLLGTLVTVGTARADAKEEIKECANTLKDFTSQPDRQIPRSVIEKAKGFAIFHIIDVALLVNGEGGPGVVIARTDKGWSGPVFVGLGGAGIGAQLGGKVKELVLVLNTQKAVDAFTGGNVTLGADLTASAGPASSSAEAETTFTSADVYSYAEGTGVFAGAATDGAVVAPRTDMTSDYYGKKVTASEILHGQVDAPKKADKLTRVIASATKTK